MDRALEEQLREIFGRLERAGYAWGPLEPDRLRAARARDHARPDELSPLVRRFGLGAGALPDDPLVARVGRHLVAHAPGTAYLGAESARLAALLEERADVLRGQRVLDLGSGSGALAFAISDIAAEVLGLELDPRAARWATAAARAQGIANVAFAHAVVSTFWLRSASEAPLANRAPTPDADRVAAARGPWDAAVFNPPMAIASPRARPAADSTPAVSAARGGDRRCGARPARDGGALGIERPLEFLALAARQLRAGGRALGLATSPLLADGRAPLFDALADVSAGAGFSAGTAARAGATWELVEKIRLHSDFNRALFRQDRYAELGIRRIELWFLHLQRTSTSIP